MESQILEKYGLFWSKYFELDSNLNPTRFNDYLYMPERFSECFWILFERLNHIHDYCLNQLISSEQKLADLNKLAGQFPDSEEAYYWEHNVDVIAKATVLLIMASFTEWGLKRVIQEMGGKLEIRKGSAKIESLLDYLKSNHFPDVAIPDEVFPTLSSFRKIRNKFAHGDWEGLEEQLRDISFKNIFAVVCSIFVALEACYWDKWSQGGI